MRLDRFSHYVCLSLYLSLVGLFFVVNCVLCSVLRSPHFLVLHLHGLTPPPVYSHSVCLPWNSFSFLLYLLEIFSMLPSGPAQVLCLLSPSAPPTTPAPPLALAIQLHEKFHSRFFERNASVKKKKREQNREKNGKHRVLNNSVLVLFGVDECFFSFFHLECSVFFIVIFSLQIFTLSRICLLNFRLSKK